VTSFKTIILIRHAKSSWKNPDWTDFERPLNKRGKRDAPLMGKWLANYGINFDLIISSPSKRTSETANLICKELGYDSTLVKFDNSLYGFHTDAVLSALKKVDDSFQEVIIIGHNPAITNVVNFLQKDRSFANVPTCGIVSINLESWEDVKAGNGKLNFFEYPKNLKNQR